MKASKLSHIAPIDRKQVRSRARHKKASKGNDDDFEQDPHHQILTDVIEGKLTPAEAEDWAFVNNQPAFAAMADPTKFDPLKLLYWTPLMAVAWVAHRAVEDVREVSNDYRRACSKWKLQKLKIPEGGGASWLELRGFVLAPRGDATFNRFQMEEATKASKGEIWRTARKNAASALEDISDALKSSKLTAQGQSAITNEIIEIPAREWRFLEFFSAGDQDAVKQRNTPDIAYNNVAFKRDDILRIWTQDFIDFHEAVTFLAHGTPMSPETYHGWLVAERAIPARPNQAAADPRNLNGRFESSKRRILTAARTGRIQIFARPGLTETNSGWYPADFGDYEAIPATTFIAEHAFGPLFPQPLYMVASPIFSARWFFPRIRSVQLHELLKVDQEPLPQPNQATPVSSQSDGAKIEVATNLKRRLPPMQAKILEITAELWPGGKFPPLVKDRNNKIREKHSSLGLTAPNDRTITRALNSDKAGQS